MSTTCADSNAAEGATHAIALPPEVQLAWQLLPEGHQAIEAGLINRTYRVAVRNRPAAILQRLAPIFAPSVNRDIDAVSAQLTAAGLLSPRLIRSTEGELWLHDAEGAVWRMMTLIPGETLLRADTPGRCYQAAGLLARFHRALWHFEHRFAHQRLGVHDTAAHVAKLEQALSQGAQHRYYRQIAALGAELLEAIGQLPSLEGLPRHITHGDPKLSNIIFAPDGSARALIDLDTVGPMPIAVELGDALRSWCAPHGEDQEGAVDLSYLEHALRGYAEGLDGLLPQDEWEPVARATEVITLELGVRFCADALRESYFGWDKARFASAADHNLARTKSQLALARSLQMHREPIARLVADTFG